MIQRTKITDLNSLRIAKVELEAEIAAREINISLKFENLKNSFFNFSNLKEEGISILKGFVADKFGFVSAALSGFVVNKIIRPKNKWIRKFSTAGVSFFVKKYSGVIERQVRSLLNMKG